VSKGAPDAPCLLQDAPGNAASGAASARGTHGSPHPAHRGLVAGLLASAVVGGIGYGLLDDIVVGMVGAVLGGWLLKALNVSVPVAGPAGPIIEAFIDAVVLLVAIRALRSRRRLTQASPRGRPARGATPRGSRAPRWRSRAGLRTSFRSASATFSLAPGASGLAPGHGAVPPGQGGVPPGQARKAGPSPAPQAPAQQAPPAQIGRPAASAVPAAPAVPQAAPPGQAKQAPASRTAPPPAPPKGKDKDKKDKDKEDKK